MKHLIFIVLILFISPILKGQVAYEKGYFINNMGEKIDCFIQNVGWRNNPDNFNYKLFENGEPLTAGLEEAKEFSVPGAFKYVAATVDIDRSSDNLEHLSNQRNPEFSKEKLFLKNLVSGKASLYSYGDSDMERFFFNVDSDSIQQLVYKLYEKETMQAKENILFRQQLLVKLKCEGLSNSKISDLGYNRNELEQLFISYNKCLGDLSETPSPRPSKIENDWFHFKITPGIEFVSLHLFDIPQLAYGAKFETQKEFRIGAEVEVVLPFNKNKWRIFIEPTYEKYSVTQEIPYAAYSRTYYTTMKVNYSSIEIPIGLRYNFFLTKKQCVFTDLMFVLIRNEETDVYNNDYQLLHSKWRTYTGAFGIGYSYGPLSLEIRHYTRRSISGKDEWGTDYTKNSLIAGLKIF